MVTFNLNFYGELTKLSFNDHPIPTLFKILIYGRFCPIMSLLARKPVFKVEIWTMFDSNQPVQLHRLAEKLGIKSFNSILYFLGKGIMKSLII